MIWLVPFGKGALILLVLCWLVIGVRYVIAVFRS